MVFCTLILIYRMIEIHAWLEILNICIHVDQCRHWAILSGLPLQIHVKPSNLLYPGAAEQVKPVKHVLHRNSEVLLQRNF